MKMIFTGLFARTRISQSDSESIAINGKPALGPDATALAGFYEYALIDKKRWTRFNMQPVRLARLVYEVRIENPPNVAEIATIGGMVKQYQAFVDPIKLSAFRVTHQQLSNAICNANQETGGAGA